MKLSWGALVSSLCCSAAAAKTGHVFVHDPATRTSPQASSPSLNVGAAGLVLAQRVGLSRFYTINYQDPALVQQINVLSGPQQKLFGGEDADKSRAHVLVWLEDVEDATDIIKDASAWSSDFTIPYPPSPSDNNLLIENFIVQAESLPKYADAKGRTYSAGIELEAALSPLKKMTFHNEYLSIFRADKSDAFSRDTLAKKLNSLLASQDLAITVVLMPPSSSHTKRAATPDGTYHLPSAFAASRRVPSEKILSLDPEPSTSPNPRVPDLEEFPTAMAANNTPVRGILPSCFNTLSICQQRTQNCSSHGECKLLHKGRGSGKDAQSTDCYGCACVATTTYLSEDKGKDGPKKVTYWGGPACQKKDISVQFWLFVATGTVLAFLISSGIGMLYSMGAEELPSVIGAGVSGPVRK
ncbi:hypothetical protein P153DRAFT_364176 [Dothidotthia symphoricarpi CBS 119687]|uniref:Uncharacterized protein n=1 Tax=Dothidotthia symphoricarpi CBS 119687 TaxID=1392245 RepID=A0A6A6APX6_9PLEO|nr:uncharacterized protein P153DRAFT_364176 [Dothidotthia symphoricarpi CBS 119687]KAF2132917.1 hypothetical protein P153DRAFT_364176 [Dothidotthia symphoricarpi CBS 119687]